MSTESRESHEVVFAQSFANRMNHIRWLMNKFDKPNVVPSNDVLGIEKRVYMTNEDK